MLVDRGGSPRRLELTTTRQPGLAGWRRYAHCKLSAAEWQRIAAGGASDAKRQEASLAQAMSELREGRVGLQPSEDCPILLKAGEQALFMLPAVSQHELRAVTTGAYGGPSIHVAKGLTIRTGAFRTPSSSEVRSVSTRDYRTTSARVSQDLAAIELAAARARSAWSVATSSSDDQPETAMDLDRYRGLLHVVCIVSASGLDPWTPPSLTDSPGPRSDFS